MIRINESRREKKGNFPQNGESPLCWKLRMEKKEVNVMKAKKIVVSIIVSISMILASVSLVKAPVSIGVSADVDWNGSKESVNSIVDDSTTIPLDDWTGTPYFSAFPLVTAQGTPRGRMGILNLRERVWVGGELALDEGYWTQSGLTDAQKINYCYDFRKTDGTISPPSLTTKWGHIFVLGINLLHPERTEFISIILERTLTFSTTNYAECTLEYEIYAIRGTCGWPPGLPYSALNPPLVGHIFTGILWHNLDINGFTNDSPGSLSCIVGRMSAFASEHNNYDGITNRHVVFELSYTFDDSMKESFDSNSKALVAWDGATLNEFSNPPPGPNIQYGSPNFLPTYTGIAHQPSKAIWGMVYPVTIHSWPKLRMDNGYWSGGTWYPVGPEGALPEDKKECQRVYINYTYDRPWDMMAGCYESNGDYAVLGYRGIGDLSMPEWEEVDAWTIHNVTGDRARASPCFADLDDDGDYDLLISNAINVPPMGYKNIGNRTDPVWQRWSGWDVPSLGGYEQNPDLADLDNDGDYDLVIGNELGHKACFFENTGNRSFPIWTRRTDWDFIPGVEWPSPCFADIDCDGDYDLLFGSYTESYCVAWENRGNMTHPAWTRKPEWDLMALPTSQHKKPDFVDLDNDGDYDLMVGIGNYTDAAYSKIWAYQNTGNLTCPVWTREIVWDIPLPGMTWIRPAFANLGGVHDIAVVNPTSKTVVGQGYSLTINTTVVNSGDYTETFNVTLYADQNITVIGDEIIIGNQTVSSLTNGTSTTLTFTWNTTGFAKGNYTISAYASPVQGETDTADNNMTAGVIVAMIGDITGPSGYPDGKIDARDVAGIASRYGAKPPNPKYDVNWDITGPTLGLADGKIDARDVSLVSSRYGQKDP
jgi:hypothetical protein